MPSLILLGKRRGTAYLSKNGPETEPRTNDLGLLDSLDHPPGSRLSILCCGVDGGMELSTTTATARLPLSLPYFGKILSGFSPLELLLLLCEA